MKNKIVKREFVSVENEFNNVLVETTFEFSNGTVLENGKLVSSLSVISNLITTNNELFIKSLKSPETTKLFVNVDEVDEYAKVTPKGKTFLKVIGHFTKEDEKKYLTIFI